MLIHTAKRIGWKFGFASLHVLLQSLSERDNLIVLTNNYFSFFHKLNLQYCKYNTFYL
ncbi:hypothetical protein TPE_1577 [Treponema pedis str. T A4]|uniref:Uncharacterized protein n=1 Tax=Treponema pedis str. T A4 TaxID=1291379 RepID=S5ZND7_9SPIR|nr:hypothetical protein TPE_1577 [Treponema pedis str. T A4]